MANLCLPLPLPSLASTRIYGHQRMNGHSCRTRIYLRMASAHQMLSCWPSVQHVLLLLILSYERRSKKRGRAAGKKRSGAASSRFKCAEARSRFKRRSIVGSKPSGLSWFAHRGGEAAVPGSKFKRSGAAGSKFKCAEARSRLPTEGNGAAVPGSKFKRSGAAGSRFKCAEARSRFKNGRGRCMLLMLFKLFLY